MVFTRVAALALVGTALANSVTAMPRVDPSVHRTLRAEGTVDLIITMKEGTTAPLNAAKESAFATRGQMIASMVTDLERHAASTQKSVEAILAQEAASTTPLFKSSTAFWISNQRSIKGASIELLAKLATMPEILEIREELILPVPKPAAVGVPKNTTEVGLLANEWGVIKVRAPDVWAKGNNGAGVVIGSIDTGVRGTHSALKGNYRGAYGWYDPEAKKAAPYDNNGHGTHTMGTIVGASGIGVAPGAKWMACKGCRTDGCSESDLLTCAQFMTCPTDTNGLNKDCSKAPRLVSNSWGGGQGDTFYQAAVNTWRQAGIIPIFANGNSGPACKTANSPGDYSNVIAVGATDINDGLASFSSKGPTVSGLLKPEVSAPGANVRSAWYTSDTAYNSISGTSMATPHVSGVVALLLAARPTLTYDQVRSALINGVDKSTLKATGYTCGGKADGVFPNNNYGYGRVNALTSLTK